MPRAQTILQSDFPYNISARCINKEWFNLPMEQVWEVFCEVLTETHIRYDLNIHSFVLMSNHFHLIATTPKANISLSMQYLMGQTSRKLTKLGNRINETYGGRYHKCILQSHKYYLNAYKYNYRNPVTARICELVQDYKFSTLPAVMSMAKKPFPVIEDLTYNSSPEDTLKWLNEKPDDDKLEAVRWGLKKPYFQSKKSKTRNKPFLEDNDTL